MPQVAILFLRVMLFSLSSIGAAAQPLTEPVELQIAETFDAVSNAQLTNAFIAAAPVDQDGRPGEHAIEPAAPSLQHEDWAEEQESGVAYPVTGNLSLGLAYEHEGIEDLTSDLIEMGVAGVDYTSHKVVVRANVALDFMP